MRTRASVMTLLIAAAVLTAGCRHYAGWVDKELRVTTVSEDAQPIERPTVRLLKAPTAEDGQVRVQLVKVEGTDRRVKRELVGKRTYVRYHWSHPIVKPLIAVTVILPFYLSYIDPHNHSGATWSKWDYLRDVGSYYNFFSAFASGDQRVDETPVVLWSEERTETVPRKETPMPGARIRMTWGDETVEEAVAGADGVASFDLRAHVRPEMAGADRQFRFVVADDESVAMPMLVKKDVIEALLPKP